MSISFAELCTAVYYCGACRETWGRNGRRIYVQAVRRRWLQQHIMGLAELHDHTTEEIQCQMCDAVSAGDNSDSP